MITRYSLVFALVTLALLAALYFAPVSLWEKLPALLWVTIGSCVLAVIGFAKMVFGKKAQ